MHTLYNIISDLADLAFAGGLLAIIGSLLFKRLRPAASGFLKLASGYIFFQTWLTALIYLWGHWNLIGLVLGIITTPIGSFILILIIAIGTHSWRPISAIGGNIVIFLAFYFAAERFGRTALTRTVPHDIR